MRVFCITLLIFFGLLLQAQASSNNYGKYSSSKKHQYKEAEYQAIWCKAHGGTKEYENKDSTRVDCLTSTNAVEFDFYNKWAESVGQALHYQLMTGKRGMVVLILENPKTQMSYFNRVKKLSKMYDFDAEYITPDIFNRS